MSHIINLLTRMVTKLQAHTLYFSQLVIINGKLKAVLIAVDQLRQLVVQCFDLLAVVSSGVVTPPLNS